MYNSHYKTTSLLALIVIIFCCGQVLAAPDYAREKRWANEVVPDIMSGDAVYLQQGNRHKFLGLYIRQENSSMAVIVVHGMGVHPNWGLIGDIRRQLSDSGYSTLSIQMPVLDATASFKAYPAIFSDAADRIAVAVSHLKTQGYKKISIVSHSNGSRMTRVFMVRKPKHVDTWVAISLTQNDTFAGVDVPVLDIYGERDLPHVLSSIQKRKMSVRLKKKSRQIVIPAAEHFFNGKEALLISKIKAYLDTFK